jgi:hypothetical protein
LLVHWSLLGDVPSRVLPAPIERGVEGPAPGIDAVRATIGLLSGSL